MRTNTENSPTDLISTESKSSSKLTPKSHPATTNIPLWTKDNIKSLRQRLGWSQAEFSRRLHCESCEVELWETGKSTPTSVLKNELYLLEQQAEACNLEVQNLPLAEHICDIKALGQIEFSEIKDEIE